VVPVVGTPEKRLQLLAADSDAPLRICVLSYELLVWLCKEFDRHLNSHFDAIVFDELSKMKTPGSARFKSARSWLMNIPVRIGLTGTPVGNHLLDIWGEMFMVGGKEVWTPGAETFHAFQRMYFYSPDPNGWVWIPHANSQERIHKRIEPFAFSISDDNAPIKQPVVRILEHSVQIPAKVMQQQKELRKQMRTELAKGVDLRVMSASAVANKLLQLESGGVFLERQPGELRPKWVEVHGAKLDALDEILEEQQGDPVLLFYHYTHEVERLLRRYPQARTLPGSGGRPLQSLDEWNRREVELLVVHPQSAGFGLNLQDGGSTLVWYTLPWSVELWQQATARLARQGQREPIVTSHVLLAGVADRMVLSALRNKGQVQSNLLEALEAM
jgi:SNF2 family DNA or RNA helicase